jgi:hypothetical protein
VRRSTSPGSGDRQRRRFRRKRAGGLVGFALNIAPRPRPGRGERPLANAQVTFEVAAVAARSAEPMRRPTASASRRSSWTVQLGALPTATVAAQGSRESRHVHRHRCQGTYNIDVRFLTVTSPARQAAFTNAAARWATLIFGNVPNIPVNLPAGSCGPNSPALNETIDDIVIFATVDSIDGPGDILGQAGPCFIRSSGKLPLLGAMIFDSADVAQLEQDGQFELVILHEMGHVLGYGTIWTDLNLLQSGGQDPRFTGAQAIAAFNRSGGQDYAAGAKVPVENCVGFPPGVCGPGTEDSHWREFVLVNELMTGFLDPGANPLSVITTASMGDLGYVVNYAASDPYMVVNPVAALAPGPSGARAEQDILRVPLGEVDAVGRVVQVTRRGNHWQCGSQGRAASSCAATPSAGSASKRAS